MICWRIIWHENDPFRRLPSWCHVVYKYCSQSDDTKRRCTSCTTTKGRCGELSRKCRAAGSKRLPGSVFATPLATNPSATPAPSIRDSQLAGHNRLKQRRTVPRELKIAVQQYCLWLEVPPDCHHSIQCFILLIRVLSASTSFS